MDIYKLVKTVKDINLNTSMKNLIEIKFSIYESLDKMENSLFSEYCNFKDKKTYQINKTQKNLDKEKLILNNTFLEYQKKEEKYKYPEQLTFLQKTINTYQQKKKNNTQKNKDLAKYQRNLVTNIVTLEDHKIKLEKMKILEKSNLEWSLGDWDENLSGLYNKFQISGKKIKCHLQLNQYFFDFHKDIHYDKLNSIMIRELSLLFEFKKLREDTRHKIKTLHKNQDIEIENTKLMLSAEKEIYITSQENLKKKLDIEMKKFADTKYRFREQHKNLEIKLEKNSNLSVQSVKNLYDQFEIKIRRLQIIENNIAINSDKYQKLIDELNDSEKKTHNLEQDNMVLHNKILKLETDKKNIIPGIIKKYHFYMNFYNYDIKDTKIKINVHTKKIESIKNTNFDMLDKTKVTRQKINILKKLQININQKIHEYQNRY